MQATLDVVGAADGLTKGRYECRFSCATASARLDGLLFSPSDALRRINVHVLPAEERLQLFLAPYIPRLYTLQKHKAAPMELVTTGASRPRVTWPKVNVHGLKSLVCHRAPHANWGAKKGTLRARGPRLTCTEAAALLLGLVRTC